MKKAQIILITISFLVLGNSCQAQEKKSIKEAIIENGYDDVDAAIVCYKRLKSEQPEAYNFEDENELNGLGYQLLNEQRTDDAIKIFRLLVDEFPNSANPYDSLGEAYLANNNTELALKNYGSSFFSR